MPRGNQSGTVELHDGKLRVRFFDQRGSRVTESTGLSNTVQGRKQAQALLKLRVAEVALGTYVRPASGPSSPTFDDYIDTWTASLVGKLNRDGRTFKPSTIEHYRRLLRGGWSPHLGHLRLAAIRPKDIDAANAEATRGHGANYSSSLVMVLKKALRQAVADGYIAGQSPAGHIKTPLPAKPRLVEGDVWTAEEVRRMLAAADEIGPAFGLMVYLGAMTGMRYGEIRALRPENVALEERVIRVRLTCAEDYSGQDAGPPKTPRSIRDLDIAPEVARRLRSHMKQLDGSSPWVFPHHLYPEQPWPYWKLRADMLRLHKAVGRRLPPHRTRHTFASNALGAGATATEVARYMGDTVQTVDAVYATWTGRDAKRAAARRFASMYDSAPILSREETEPA